MKRPHDLNTDRQPSRAKSRGDGKRRAAAHGDGKYPLHPFVIGLQLFSRDFLRPMEIDVERKQLRGRNYEVIIFFEEPSHCLIPAGPYFGRRGNIEGSELELALHLEYCLWFQEGTLYRILVVSQKASAGLPRTQLQPCSPDGINRIVWLGFLYAAAHRLEHLQGTPANVQHAGFERQIALKVSRPCNPLPFEIRFQAPLKCASIAERG